MNIEEVRQYALGLDAAVTEDEFAENWLSWRIGGKWFMLMQLDAPQPRVAVKLPPDVAMDPAGTLMRVANAVRDLLTTRH